MRDSAIRAYPKLRSWHSHCNFSLLVGCCREKDPETLERWETSDWLWQLGLGGQLPTFLDENQTTSLVWEALRFHGNSKITTSLLQFLAVAVDSIYIHWMQEMERYPTLMSIFCRPSLEQPSAGNNRPFPFAKRIFADLGLERQEAKQGRKRCTALNQWCSESSANDRKCLHFQASGNGLFRFKILPTAISRDLSNICHGWNLADINTITTITYTCNTSSTRDCQWICGCFCGLRVM